MLLLFGLDIRSVFLQSPQGRPIEKSLPGTLRQELTIAVTNSSQSSDDDISETSSAPVRSAPYIILRTRRATEGYGHERTRTANVGAEKEKKGLIVVITGYGKGKTTSALGMVLTRGGAWVACLCGPVMKGDMYAGEIDALKSLAPQVEHHLTGKGFCGIQGNPYPYSEHRANARTRSNSPRRRCCPGSYVLVCDEINNALKLKLVDLLQSTAIY